MYQINGGGVRIIRGLELVPYNDNQGVETTKGRLEKLKTVFSYLNVHSSFIFSLYLFTIISIFQELMKGGWNKSGGIEFENQYERRGLFGT